MNKVFMPLGLPRLFYTH